MQFSGINSIDELIKTADIDIPEEEPEHTDRPFERFFDKSPKKTEGRPITLLAGYYKGGEEFIEQFKKEFHSVGEAKDFVEKHKEKFTDYELIIDDPNSGKTHTKTWMISGREGGGFGPTGEWHWNEW